MMNESVAQCCKKRLMLLTSQGTELNGGIRSYHADLFSHCLQDTQTPHDIQDLSHGHVPDPLSTYNFLP